MGLYQRITRRRALGAVLAAGAAALLRKPRALGAAAAQYEGPFVDAHSHLRWSVDVAVDELMALYDAAGVRGAWLFGEPWPLATAARDRYPGRVAPFLAEGYANAVHPHSSYVNPEGLAQLLEGGFAHGLGEVILRHSPYRLGAAGGYASAPANSVPAVHPALIEAYRIAGRYGVPVTVHQEWFFADELGRALRTAPGTTFVWAHAGHGPARVVRGALEAHPNLLADLSARTPWIGPGTVLLRRDGSLAPEWAALLHDHADRFLVGLDLFAPAHFRASYVGQLVAYYRGLLGQLEPEVAALIGHGNAERIAPFTRGRPPSHRMADAGRRRSFRAS